ncbi:hypothetical protein OF83DRAFT_1214572 [Amylostereum chailletii]|nr:hypothetical protein OF83DRAFT_1214572 [Amylostereum chailletii]
MSFAQTTTETRTILLRPRPLARNPGSFTLLPLLPLRPPPKVLPSEIWSHVLSFVVQDDDVELERLEVEDRRRVLRWRWKMLFVCKTWLDDVRPLLYASVHIFTLSSLDKFVTQLHHSEQHWDSIRRIPYSTPGRWVQAIDVSEVRSTIPAAANSIDRLLTTLFPLLPFLENLTLSRELTLSKSATRSLRHKDGTERLRTLKGLRVSPHIPEFSLGTPSVDDPTIELLQRCEQLQQLEVSNDVVVGPDQQTDLDPDDLLSAFPTAPALNLPRLQFLFIHVLYPSSVLSALLNTPLPALRHLMITPFDDGPNPALADFLSVHGAHLSTLHLATPKHWPITVQPRTLNVLRHCPHLKHLSIDYPLPTLILPPGMNHPLQVLTIPRPNTRFLQELERLLPRLAGLSVVRARNVRWLKSGMSGKALEAGVQGEMRDWRKRLARRGVRLVDGDWKDPL